MRKDSKILKKKLRKEKKCKKLSALLEIAKLNDEDRMKKLAQNTEGMSAVEQNSNESEFECEPNISTKTPVGSAGKPLLHGEDYLNLKRLLKERREKLSVIPKFRLREIGHRATLEVDKDNRIPIYFPDLQHLLLYSQIGYHSPYVPTRWCQLDKFNRLEHTNVLIVENVSLYHFQSYESTFSYLHSHFPYQLELITPAMYKSDLVQELVIVPLTGQHTKTLMSEYGTLENAVKRSTDIFDRVSGTFPNEHTKQFKSSDLPKYDNFPRTDLLLSGWQMIEENFPMPIKGLTETKYSGYVLTKDVYKEVTPFSPMFGLDCEMCLTSAGSELTRISLVDECGKTVYDELVKPLLPIINYLTRFSGITPNMMKYARKTLKDVQEDLRKILPPDAILVGQSLNGDLHALQMMHPYVIDTSVIYNLTGDRVRKTKLQTLAQEFLNLTIQNSKVGHCSTEDSSACMYLVKHKLKQDITYGDAVIGNISTQINCYTALGNPNFGTSFLKRITKVDKTAQIVALKDSILKYSHYTYKANEPITNKINCEFAESNEEVIDKLCKTAANFTFNLGHVYFTDDELQNDIKNVCIKINKWAECLHKSSKKPELCVVVLGGHAKYGNGACFLSMKKLLDKVLV